MGEGANLMQEIETIQSELHDVKKNVSNVIKDVGDLKESDKNQWGIINTVQDTLKIMTQQATRTDEKVDQLARSFDSYKTEQSKANGHQEGMISVVKETLDKVLDINRAQSVESAATARTENTNKKDIRVEIWKTLGIGITIVGGIVLGLIKFL